MKELYQTPHMEFVEFSLTDVITTSVGTVTTEEWVPRDNEGNPGYDSDIWSTPGFT